MRINGKPCLLDRPGHEVTPMSAGNGDGQFVPEPVLSEGVVGGRKRVLGPLPFRMIGCTGKGGSVGKGSGSVPPSQSVAYERGRALMLDGDDTLCHGKQTRPNGVTSLCVCRVTVRTQGSAGPDEAAGEGQHAGPGQSQRAGPDEAAGEGQRACSAATPRVPLALRLAVAPADAARSEEAFALKTEQGEQSLVLSAASPWGKDSGLEYGLGGEPDQLRITGPGGREQVFFFHGAPPLRGDGQYPSGRPLFAPQDIHAMGFGPYNVNRFRIFFRVPPRWRLAGVWRHRERQGRPVRALDLDRGLPAVEQLAAEFTERFAYYFNGGVVGRPTFEDGQPLPQRVDWGGGPRQPATVLRLDLGGQTLFGFEAKMNALFPELHVDWVSVAWRRPRGFAVQTVQRKHKDWASRALENQAFLRSLPAAAAAEAFRRMNRHHFLSGRRSWVLGKGAEVQPGLAEDIYFLDTSSIERYTGIVHGVGTHHGGFVAMQSFRSVRETVVAIWSTLLRNYVRLNGFVPQDLPAGDGWQAAPGEPRVVFTEGRLYRNELDTVPWVDELSRLHPALREQLQGPREVSGPPLKPGIYLAARDLESFLTPHGRSWWVPTHQFLVLVPSRPGDFPEVIDLGGRTRAIVLGAGPVDGRLAARGWQEADEKALREFCAPPGQRGHLFNTEVRLIDTQGRPPDQVIAAILAAVSSYERESRHEPIRYPTWNEQLGTEGCLNSNSWAQSLLEAVLGYAPDREHMAGYDACRENRIPRRYFLGGGA